MKSLDRQTGSKLGEAEGDVKGSAGGKLLQGRVQQERSRAGLL